MITNSLIHAECAASEVLFKASDELLNTKLFFSQNIGIEKFLGQMILNRITGIAFDNIEMDTMSYEVYKTLKFIAERDLLLFNQFMANLKYLCSLVGHLNFDYALLKGAYLTPFLYKSGHRTSNDIDILLLPEDVTKMQNLLIDNGFSQAHIKSEAIVKATRKEVIESKMNFGETVPFVKRMGDYLFQVDINFSLDFKPSRDTDIISRMLSSTISVGTEDGEIGFKTLCHGDFLIHLCCHLYKEATTYDWVLSRRDLMLYKFSDINVFIHKHENSEYFDTLIKRIKQFGLEKECYYTFENASIIYPKLNLIDGFIKAKEAIRPTDLAFMRHIIWPREKKLFQHHMSFTDWFFCPNRIAQLEEIPYETDQS